MLSLRRISLFSLVVSFLFFFLSSKVSASEGIFELKNTKGQDGRCYAFSALMQDLNFNILVSCRDIIYPGGTDVFQYAVWASPDNGSKAIKLGNLGFGKQIFKTQTAFSSIFVTKERTADVSAPSGDVVMQGSQKAIEFLETKGGVTRFEEPELGEPQVTPSPTQTPQVKKTTFNNLLGLGGTVGFIALFITILLVFLITRR
jgi:hypothetical protein